MNRLMLVLMVLWAVRAVAGQPEILVIDSDSRSLMNTNVVFTNAMYRGGTNMFPDIDWAVFVNTNLPEVIYGVTSNTAYRGDWGDTSSNLAATAYGWGNHAAAGYATGSPVYVESDPAFAAASNSLRRWNRIEPITLTAVSGTVTIPYTNTTAFYTTLSGAATLTVATASFPTTAVFTARIDILGSSLSLTLPTNVFLASGQYSVTSVTVNANGITTLILDKPAGGNFPCRVMSF